MHKVNGIIVGQSHSAYNVPRIDAKDRGGINQDFHTYLSKMAKGSAIPMKEIQIMDQLLKDGCDDKYPDFKSLSKHDLEQLDNEWDEFLNKEIGIVPKGA